MAKKRRFGKRTREQLTEDQKLTFRARLKYQLFGELRKTFDRLRSEENLTQEEIAFVLDIDKSLVSKRLGGETNMTLDTISDMARAIGARVEVKVLALKDLGSEPNLRY